MRYYKPIEIARELQVSTSALRHYESWGLIPKPKRAKNGYRLYTIEHLAYFRCLRAMFAGFGVPITSKVLKHLQKKQLDQALWIVNQELSKLHQEKLLTDQTLEVIQTFDFPSVNDRRIQKKMTIGEVALLANVTPSAIRHWEKEGLLLPHRDPLNGYRIYSPNDLRKILLIRMLRESVYFLKSIKELIQAFDNKKIDDLKKITQQAVSIINRRNRLQLHAVHQLMELCNVIHLLS
ncbi:DNA-binding transcriptional regulator, MerR family [Seinonella peptonophila]|uniref:DNA-binding transcriptional regulator, MerR family n=1 Tax=Seinonella peptonophila TaxID=112248 RepID=A0A1M4SQ15_9BACL|nr:TioE family transcriptional regulator [Seinonella peptonophila]SHE34265.1 DNA-binding transcriptional regulator, MerR family [Seinonella peptonophila]